MNTNPIEPKKSLIRELVYPILAIGFNLAVIAMHFGAQWFISDSDGLTWVDTESYMIAMFLLVYGALRIDPPGGFLGMDDGEDHHDYASAGYTVDPPSNTQTIERLDSSS